MVPTEPGADLQGDDVAVREAVADGFAVAVATLGELVRIPSIAFPGFDPDQVQRSAQAVAEHVRRTGAFDVVDVRRAPTASGGMGSPAVVARREPAAGAPTVLLYAHHDVQPPGRDEAWSSPPFTPTVRGERLYGRGASDDKAGVVIHLAAVRALLQATAGGPRLGLALFVEGEEEAGSSSFDAFLEQNADTLAGDVIVVADSDNAAVGTPSLTTSLRGNVIMTVTVSTMDHASHSGMFGGAVPDALLATIRLLSTLWDERGAVAVEGLAATLPPADDADRAAPQQLARDAGLLPGVTSIGVGSVADRLWRGPAITVTGIDAPDVRNASNTVLGSVRVRLSARVGPGTRAADAAAALTAHLRQHAPFGAHVDIADVDAGDPYLADTEGTAAIAALGALRDAWGTEPARTGIGGSIPFLAILSRTFPRAQILITGVEDPETRAHAPNESQHLGVLHRAILAEALLLARLDRGV